MNDLAEGIIKTGITLLVCTGLYTGIYLLNESTKDDVVKVTKELSDTNSDSPDKDRTPGEILDDKEKNQQSSNINNNQNSLADNNQSNIQNKNQNNMQYSYLDLNRLSYRRPLHHVKLIGYQTNSVSYYYKREQYGSNNEIVIPGVREYNLCTFDDGQNHIVLITKSPESLIINSNYSVEYGGLRADQRITASQFIRTFVGSNLKTLDDYPFDSDIEGVIQKIEVKIK